VFLIALGGYTLVRVIDGPYFYVNSSIADDFGVTQKALAVVISVSAAIGIVVSIICGSLADLIGRKRMFGVTIIGSGVFIGLQSLAPSLLILTFLRSLAHGFISAMSPIKTTIVTGTAPAHYRGVLRLFLKVQYSQPCPRALRQQVSTGGGDMYHCCLHVRWRICGFHFLPETISGTDQATGRQGLRRFPPYPLCLF
jgi:hypothetical protein